MRQRFTRFIAGLALLLAVHAAGAPQAAVAHGWQIDAGFADLGGTLAQRPAPLLRSGAVTRPQLSNSRPANATCAKLTASAPASWFATDSDGNVDTSTEVDHYPSGSSVIAPGFKYDCAPKDIDIVIIIYNQAYGTQPALVQKSTLQGSSAAGIFFYALTTPDDTALQEGNWRVAFYQDKTPISTGEILLGASADMDIAKQAMLQGSVTDLRTGQPVAGARVFVLNPGVALADFASDTRREDIFVQTRTDDQGEFSLWKPLDRNTQYAMLIAADGYKLRGTDRLIIGDQATSPVSLDIQIVQR